MPLSRLPRSPAVRGHHSHQARVGKIVALRPVVVDGWIWLAVMAAANAVLGVAVYLRWLRPVVTTAEVTGAPEPTETAETTPTRPPAAQGPGNRRALSAGGAMPRGFPAGARDASRAPRARPRWLGGPALSARRVTECSVGPPATGTVTIP